MSKHTPHTPGPWTINKKKTHPWIVECETNVPGHKGEVAIVGYLPYARLIAAAPELLEACKRALLDYDILGESKLPVYGFLKQAITKAEGQDE